MKSWIRATINGVFILPLVKHVDKRGFLSETFREDEVPLAARPAMSYISYTEPGVSRGPHEHRQQTDMFSFLGPGSFLIRLWDNRKESKTCGCFMELYAGQEYPVTLIVPPGVVHGYKNISRLERGMVINYPDRLFKGWGKKEDIDEIRYEDCSKSSFTMEDSQ